MADKMMRVAGRSSDGRAKAFSVNNEGHLRVSPDDMVLSKELIKNPISVTRGHPYEIFDIKPYKSFTITGRVGSNAESLRIGVANQVFGGSSQAYNIERVEVVNNRFISEIKIPKSDEVRVAIISDDDVLEVTHLYMTSVEASSSSSLSVKNLKGDIVDLTAVEDDNGNAVLRVVDAAPRAYDVGNDVIRTMQMNAPLKKHKTIQLVWLDSSLTGKTFSIDLKGNTELLQGEKGYLFYQGIDDGHDIYLNYRIGGSGNYVKKYIVENGEGASDKNNVMAMIPDECFPFLDLSITPQAKTGVSELVFETKTGDLTGLRAYLVIM